MAIEDDAWDRQVPEDGEAATEERPQPQTGGSAGASGRSGGSGAAAARAATPPWALIGGAVVAVIAVVVVIIIATGGHSGHSAPSGISKAAFVRKSDAICAAEDPISTQDAQEENFAAFASAVGKTADEIEALGIPTTDAAQVRSIEGQINKGVALAGQAVQIGGQAGIQDLEQAQSEFQAADAGWGQIGATSCAG